MALTLTDVQTSIEAIYEKMVTRAQIDREYMEAGRADGPSPFDVDTVVVRWSGV